MIDDAYRQRKIDHVTGFTGGSIWEINEVTFIAPAAAALWAVLQTRQKFFDPYTPAAYLTDFLIHVGAILFAATAYSDSPVTLLGLLLLPAIASVMNTPAPEEKKAAKPTLKDDLAEPDPLDDVPVKPYITTYRGAMMIITCVCILAVDFDVFPRRFAKVETWGTSLMDMGVGSFVFGAGVVAARQQLKDEAQEGHMTRSTFLERFNDSLRHSLPLLALGFIRLYSVKASNYQEHVTEYGVHWNFFFTLGLLPPFVAIFQSFFRLVPSYQALAFWLVVPYEMSFWYSDVGLYIISAPRVDFFSSNREGIYSFIGYLGIFLAGQGIGIEALRRDVDVFTPMTSEDEWVASVLGGDESVAKVRATRNHNSLLKLAKWTGIWLAVYVLLVGPYGPRLTVSRRLANLPYLAWVCVFNCWQLLMFRAIEGYAFPMLYKASNKTEERKRCAKATSKVLHAFNRNGLAVFLVANLLTGVVNMNLATLDMSDVASMGVLVGYMLILTAFALTLDHFNISIKL
ncbi:hypothetical protein AAFC00_000733 [Neodothiora populina]|uniref:GPI-anchored wall transfer protein n=1 Tax=Neodothiora populina TaxID=2781224 RepID=A0ABR3PDU8_9PEZI